MSNLRSDPDSEVIEDIILGVKRFVICRLAAKVGICNEVDAFADPPTSRDISERRHWNHDITERLLDTLVTLQFVCKSTSSDGTSRYENTPTAKKYLTGQAAADFVIRCDYHTNMYPKACDNLSKNLIGGSDIDVHTLDRYMNGMVKLPVEPFKISPQELIPDTETVPEASHEQFMVAMDTLLLSNLNAMVNAFNLGSFRKAVDLGGGSGLLAKKLAQQYPLLSVTVFDLPKVTSLTETKFADDDSGRLHVASGNLLTDDLPPADLYTAGHILHLFSAQDVDQIVKKIYQLLPPGGAFLLFEKFLNEDRTQPLWASIQNLFMASVSEGRERTLSEYKQLLEGHGFVEVEGRVIEGTNSYDAMIGRKPL